MKNLVEKVLCTFILIIFSAPLSAGEILRSNLEFSIADESKEFRKIEVFYEKDNGANEKLDLKGDNKFALVLDHDFETYYNEVTLKFVFDKEENADWPKDFNDIEFRVGVLIRRDSPVDINIPINVPQNIRLRDIEKLDQIPSFNEALKRYVQLGIIYNYFDGAIGPKDPYSRRVARIWFDAAYKMAVETGNRFFIPEDIKIALENSFNGVGDKAQFFSEKVVGVNSRRFTDMNRFQDSIEQSQCKEALAMFDELYELGSERPDLVEKQRTTLTDLRDRRNEIAHRCALPLIDAE